MNKKPTVAVRVNDARIGSIVHYPMREGWRFITPGRGTSRKYASLEDTIAKVKRLYKTATFNHMFEK